MGMSTPNSLAEFKTLAEGTAEQIEAILADWKRATDNIDVRVGKALAADAAEAGMPIAPKPARRCWSAVSGVDDALKDAVVAFRVAYTEVRSTGVTPEREWK